MMTLDASKAEFPPHVWLKLTSADRIKVAERAYHQYGNPKLDGSLLFTRRARDPELFKLLLRTSRSPTPTCQGRLCHQWVR
eukprot:753745-Amphidinium_carterae.1